MKEKLEKFILDNKLTFEKGRRNSDLTIITGFALWLDVRPFDFDEVLQSYYDKDPELQEESNRVWRYADDSNYGKWWDVEANRNKYILN